MLSDKGEESFHISCLLPPVVKVIAVFWSSLRGEKIEFLLHSIFSSLSLQVTAIKYCRKFLIKGLTLNFKLTKVGSG